MTPEEIAAAVARHCRELPAGLTPEIRNLDLIPVWFLLAKRGWSLERVLEADLAYRKLLALAREGRDVVPPTPDADEFAHVHSVCHLFASQCETVFGRGRQLQHYAFAGVFGPQDIEAQRQRLAATRSRMQELFP